MRPLIAGACCCGRETDPGDPWNCCGMQGEPVYMPSRVRVRWTGTITVTAAGCDCSCNDPCGPYLVWRVCTAMSGSGTYQGGVISEGTAFRYTEAEGVPGCYVQCDYLQDGFNNNDPRQQTLFNVNYPPGNCFYGNEPGCIGGGLCDAFMGSGQHKVGVRFAGISPNCELNRWEAYCAPGFGVAGVLGMSLAGGCPSGAVVVQDADNVYGVYRGPPIMRCPNGLILPGSQIGVYEPLNWNLVKGQWDCQGLGSVVLNKGFVVVEAA